MVLCYAQNLILGAGDIDGAIAYATDTNFNDLYGSSSCYRFNGYTGDIYLSSNGYGIIKTTYTSVGYCEQTAYVFNNNSVYVRTKTSSSSSWASWSRCDNFGCNTLAKLKAALAAV